MTIHKFLIVSLGSIGKRHLKNLKEIDPGFSVAIWHLTANTKSESRIEQLNTIEDVVRYQPDAAIIASPASTHLAIATSLVRLGIPVFIEKPMSISTAGISDLITEADANNVPLMIGYNLRFMPSLIETKRLIHSGAIGKVITVRAEVGQYLPDWRPGNDYRTCVSAQSALGGGALLELSHELDYLYWFFGLPKSVICHGGRFSQLEINVEDSVDILMTYENPSMQVSSHMDLLQRSPVRTCKFIGSEGTLIWNGIEDCIDIYTPDTGMWRKISGLKLQDRNLMYMDELRHFIKVIRQKKAPCIDGIQGYEVMAMIDAARTSMHTGCSVEVHPYAH